MKLNIIKEELSASTPYMLRNDGKLLKCGRIHPYFKLEYYDSDYENLQELLTNEYEHRMISWFYENTQHQSVKNMISDFVSAVINSHMAHESLFKNIPIDSDCTFDRYDCMELFDELNAELNQEFCRVRTSNFYYGGSDKTIYFRISSVDFNWFNLIWEVVYNNKRWIEAVTVARDPQTFGTDSREFYNINGKETLDMPVDEFLELSGRPVIESVKSTEDIKQPRHIEMLNAGKSLYEAFGGTNPVHLIRRYEMRVRHNENVGFVPTDIVNENKKYFRVKRTLFGDPKGQIKTFAILSSENPLGWKDSTEEEFKQKYLKWVDNPRQYNKDSIAKIKSTELLHKVEENGETALKYSGLSYVNLKGKYGDNEHSFIIFNCTLNDAKTIAGDYGQESFFFGKVHNDGADIAYYMTKNACKTYELIDTSKTVTYEDDATDFFSKYGFKFRINMSEFGDDVPKVENTDEFEESLDDNRTFMSRATHRRSAYKK